ncbi:hypothetical protein DL89DRAFT_26790 [Linderina pennispora]|uniref:Secreted protein n=1 Tax=Linderina pennispora TaxID=61395 RepID=A0A1Y1W3J5_9FUNG|nr:uncharacterized protein DL89DRAFT_26790 [Linderina pennispora]ORX68119.1 hypothetical protein DL89DRAFT_26790 [Linderina pennispora]
MFSTISMLVLGHCNVCWAFVHVLLSLLHACWGREAEFYLQMAGSTPYCPRYRCHRCHRCHCYFCCYCYRHWSSPPVLAPLFPGVLLFYRYPILG